MEPFRSWFGFSRRERRSSFILLLLVAMIISVRYIFPGRNIKIEDVTEDISGSEVSGLPYGEKTSSPAGLFEFDPNTVSYDTMIKLGFASKEANTLISYRNKGGKFRRPADLKKVYGIEEGKAGKLIPFVKVATDTAGKVSYNSDQKRLPLLDINSCDSATLVRLPGIGPVLSARIIKYRQLLGGFARADQIKEVYGLPEETYDLIKGRIFIDTLAITRVDVNSAEYKELAHIPYFERYEVTAILRYRELKGRITGINDLVENKLITNEKAAKAGPYIRFE
ncbi:MAG: helix-hairpin-helix domain-containing protein [Bacteroidales bacterium]|nr:helix-hairpin-helix domain-containing protein [Bacteroidales bacterium]